MSRCVYTEGYDEGQMCGQEEMRKSGGRKREGACSGEE